MRPVPNGSDLAALSVLADGQRRRLYERVEGEPGRSAGELAATLGIGRTLVLFHLGKLADAGLVESAPLPRQPGVRGRPAQGYRATGREVTASVPDRRYDLLAGVLLDGLADHRVGESAQAGAERAARARGAALSGPVGRGLRSVSARLARLEQLLADLGYLPRRDDHTLTVRSCPFDKLRPSRTQQVCPVNLALAEGYVEGLGLSDRVRVELRPSDDCCCVVFRT